MEHYQIFCDAKKGTIKERIEQLHLQVSNYLQQEQMEGRRLQYTKIFLSDAANQEAELKQSPLMQLLSDSAYTITQQPPVNGAKIAVLMKLSDEDDHFILNSIRLTDEEAANKGSYVQTLMLFEKYLDSIKNTGMTLKDNCLRTWIYVRDIDANYAGVVKARNDIFKQHGLTIDTHFIASTGIGGRTCERNVLVSMDFLTLPEVKKEDIKYLKALDHLNPTHEYGVAFERGTRLTLANKQLFYISGTASINNKGEVLFEGDVVRQAERLQENISALLADGGATIDDVKYFIVYLRDIADAQVIDDYMQQHFSSVPYIITHANVCRPAWLIEMECIASKAI